MNKASGFQFKQFFIEHDQVAMKVGTDSIILGSWLACGGISHKANRILDIGTGSGLLAIMLAQESPQHCGIVGIDIEPMAIQQAEKNAANSPWPHKLSFTAQALQQYQIDKVDHRFDLVVSNPPYYPAGQVFDTARQTARHNQQLSYASLLQHSAKLLNPQGYFACIIPSQFRDEVIKHANDNELCLNQQLSIRTGANKPVIRVVLQFSVVVSQPYCEELIIHADEGGYSTDYKKLCKDYYLNF